MDITSDLIKKVVSFQTVAPAILGLDYTNVTVLAILDADTAMSLDRRVYDRHKKVYPYLPIGTPNDHRTYEYIKVSHPDGTYDILGIPWISASTVEIVSPGTIVIELTGFNSAVIPVIRNAILSAVKINNSGINIYMK